MHGRPGRRGPDTIYSMTPTSPGSARAEGAQQPRKTPEQLRSHGWFGIGTADGLRTFSHRSRMRGLGYLGEEHLGKPVIGILNTWSDINPCHAHLRERAQAVKRGVWQAGGFPLEFPVATLSETYQKPTPMMYRNLLAMETEELLRSYPIDGAVLMGGCDKTTPGLLMGAASADIPAIYVTAGPMLRGNYRGQPLGSGTDVWKFWDDYRAGLIGECELSEVECGIARSAGHCMTMGTASTMTSSAEALGMTLPGMASIPAVDSAHQRMASASGSRIVQMVWEDLTPSRILTREAFEDAVATVLALGGSTNAFIHLIAMAGRAGVALTLDDFDAIARRVPWLANIRPSGKYLMEDFYYAGGLPALLGQLAAVPGALHPGRPTVSGRPFGDQITGVPVYNEDVIRAAGHPLAAEGGVAVLRGNLAPHGAVIKHIAAEPRLLKHTGPAVVFDNYQQMQQRIDDPALAITPDSVLVLRSAGPVGGPGMPEYGMLPIPRYLLEAGVRDMVRISDARMSGTSYGACVLHVAPESHVGGPLALVRTGDLITLDVPARSLDVNIDDRSLAGRRAQWQPPAPRFERGYGLLYSEQITQANEGCDFRFLARRGAAANPEPNPR
jgi:dihydroxy-acid dehydratase